MSDSTICCLSRLTVFLPTPNLFLDGHPKRFKRQELSTLDESCDSQVHLLSKAEVDALTFSLVGVPGLAVGAYKTVKKLACAMVKNINSTSRALSLLNNEQQVLRQKILDNRAAIDYLLLLHHKRCEQIKNMCCFNLTDNSYGITSEIQNLRKLAASFTQAKGLGLIDWLTSWLPDLTWLKELFIVGVILVFCALATCIFAKCFIQCCWKPWKLRTVTYSP